MSARSILIGCIIALVAVGLALALAPGRPPAVAPAQGAGPGPGPGPSPSPSPRDPLTAYRGKTVLLIMGMPGCPGTEKASAFFSTYAAAKPAQVELLRIDVPPPGGRIDESGPWSAPFTRQIDRERAIAATLGFFSYPTFYVIDRDGVIRFAGPFEPTRIEAMVAELAAEKPVGEKRMFSPVLPAIGAPAAAFTATTLEGKEVALSGLLGKRATLLFFGSTTCPFSRQAAQTLPALIAAYADQGLGVAIINQGEKAEAIRDFYAGQSAPVIVDADGAISLGKYGVWAVPFCFVLDGDGKVLARQAYTAAAATGAVAKALGLSYDVLLPQSGAG